MLPHLVHIYQTPTRTTRRKILGHRKLCVHPGMILGSSEYPRNPRILRQGGDELCPSWDDPRIVRVSQESQDTQTGGGGELCPSWDDPRIVQVSQESQDTQTGGGMSCVHPGMIPGSSEYPRKPRILRQGGGGGELCPSWDDPRIVPSIPGIPGYSDRGG